MAMALGLALRSAVWAVVAVLVLVFAPAFLGGVLPDWFSDDVLVWGPIAASDAITIGHLPDAADGLSPALALLAVAAWLAIFLGGAWAVLEQRDA